MIDVVKLSDWLCSNAPEVGPVRAVDRFAGGQSNPTFQLKTGTGLFVLRRKPKGALLKGAHAVEREARIQMALHATGFPVPRIIGVCEDSDIIGSPFYVMEKIDGRLFWDSSFPQAPVVERASLFDAMNQTIAKLHLIDPTSLELSDFGRPDNYLQRQIARWSAQYRDDVPAGRIYELDALVEWLPSVDPGGDAAAIVHGDFRVDNILFAQDRPEVLAVIDWELSTLGHPLADFAYHMMMYRLPPSLPGGIAGVDVVSLGLPAEEEYVERYCRRTGQSRLNNLDIYIAYNLFRFAAIVHGIKGRLIRGNASSPEAGKLVDQLPMLSRIAFEQAVASGMRS